MVFLDHPVYLLSPGRKRSNSSLRKASEIAIYNRVFGFIADFRPVSCPMQITGELVSSLPKPIQNKAIGNSKNKSTERIIWVNFRAGLPYPDKRFLYQFLRILLRFQITIAERKDAFTIRTKH